MYLVARILDGPLVVDVGKKDVVVEVGGIVQWVLPVRGKGEAFLHHGIHPVFVAAICWGKKKKKEQISFHHFNAPHYCSLGP
jgi:hypothetical protein